MEQPRVLKGTSTAGQFAATAHAEPDITLEGTTAPVLKNPDWHEAAEALMKGGRTPQEARCAVTLLLATKMNQAYLKNANVALSAGRDTDAAMFTIAFSVLKDMPAKMHAAGGDEAAVRGVATDTRRRLLSAGSLLDGTHPTGRQPVFKAADDVLADFEDFLAPVQDPAAGNTSEGSQQ